MESSKGFLPKAIDTGEEETKRLLGRLDIEEWKAEHATMLGAFLFLSPPVVMAYANHWLTWNVQLKYYDSMEGERTLEHLLFCVLKDDPVLALDMMKETNPVDGKARVTTTYCFLSHDTENLRSLSCTSHIIKHMLNSQEENSEIMSKLFDAVTLTLSAYSSNIYDKSGNVSSVGLFGQCIEGDSGSRSIFDNFRCNEILKRMWDRSAHFIAIGMYIVTADTQASQELKMSKDMREKGKDNWAVSLRSAAATKMAIDKVWEIYIQSIKRLSDTMPDAIQESIPDIKIIETSTGQKTLEMPDESVLGNEKKTLKWIHFALTQYVLPRGFPLADFIRELWHRKSEVLLVRFYSIVDQDIMRKLVSQYAVDQ